MTVNRNDIRRYPLPASSVTIQYSLDFEEQEARIFAGIGLAEYEALPGDPRWCDESHPISKAEIIVLYRMHVLIEQVQIAASSKKRQQ